MGLTPLLDSYLQSLPDLFQPHVDKFREIFEAVVPGMEGIVFFMRKNLKETVTTVDTCLVKGQFNLMASLLKRYVRDPMKGEEPLSGAQKITWSLGSPPPRSRTSASRSPRTGPKIRTRAKIVGSNRACAQLFAGRTNRWSARSSPPST